MEEGKVTDINNQEAHILSVDDLVMEIGKMHVEKMSLDRKVEILNSKVKPVIPSREKELFESNKRYEENNRKLSDELVIIRNKYSKDSTKYKEIDNKVIELTDLVKSQADKIDTLEKEKSITKKPTRRPRTKKISSKKVSKDNTDTLNK